MLYVFHGSNVSIAAEKAHTLINSLRAKKADAAFVRIEADHWSPTVIEEHLGGQGLFSNKYIVFLDRVTENGEAKESLPSFAEAMQESTNIFIVLESKLNAELRKSFEKSAEKMVEVEGTGKKEEGKSGGKEEFNIFALADAFGSRDPFKSWALYRQAVDAGTEPENIIGTLFWQAKSMKLCADAPTAAAAGVSPFIFSKAKRAAGNFSPAELNALTERLITAYHDGHRGKGNIEFNIERMLLGLKAK